VRYFGGTLLGTSGLINAYKTAAADALGKADIVTRIIEAELILKYTYAQMNDVMQIIKQENLQITDTRFEIDCSLRLLVRKSDIERITGLFSQIYCVAVETKEHI